MSSCIFIKFCPLEISHIFNLLHTGVNYIPWLISNQLWILVINKICCIYVLLLAGIEDEENWHGKPLAAKSEAAIKVIEDNISNKGPHGLTPKSPSNLAKAVNISNIKLSEPPTYDKNAQVRIITNSNAWLFAKHNDEG